MLPKYSNYYASGNTIDFNDVDIEKNNAIKIQSGANMLNSWLGSTSHTAPTSFVIITTGHSTCGILWCIAYDGSYCYVRTNFDSWRVWKQITLAAV